MTTYHVDTLQSTISKNHPVQFDKQGVPKAKIPYTQQHKYHVTDIASYAIMNEDNPKIFNAQINWLVKNIEKDGSYQHHFRFPFYKNFPTPWVGGLAQGLAISALRIAYQKNQNPLYKKTAEKAFQGLKNNCIINKKNYTWIEEYPITLHILNGFIYAIFGVYDLTTISKRKDATDLFHQCINTLEDHLNQYDLGYWSRYSLHDHMPATLFYHQVHIKQLHALYKITQKNIFISYAQKWEKQITKSNQIKINQIRLINHIKKHGIFGSYQRYKKRKRWMSSK